MTQTTNTTTLLSPNDALLADTAADAAQRIERHLDQVDSLFAQLDAGQFDPLPLDYPWPADLKLSVVIPVYNERDTILTVVSRVMALPVPKEIIVVDDCSTDGTRDCLESLNGMAGLRVLWQPRNLGKGAALRCGFEAAEGDVVIIQDADLEYEPRDMLQVVRPIVMGEVDVAFGSRYLQGRGDADSLAHRIGNGLLTGLSNLLNGVQLTDMETCHKAFRIHVLRSLELKQNRFGFEPEVTAKIARRGYEIREVPIHYRPRGYAQGKKIGARDLLSTLWCILRYGFAD
jgi:glycosyltransferase involved in cell wall biosynthesis